MTIRRTKRFWFVSLCTLVTAASSVAAGGAPVNDDCANAIPIPTGTTAYDTTLATTDGVAHPACDAFGDGGATVHDIWFVHTATCDGRLTVTTCEQLGGSATYDTDLVVYNNTTSCPPTDADVLGCNEDDPVNPCGGSSGGFHSTVKVNVVSGNQYLIRVGGWSNEGVDNGAGVLNIFCEPHCEGASECQLPDQSGHGAGGTVGATSDANPNAGFVVADNFVASSTGTITSVCWWGFYFDFNLTADCGLGTGDDFTITYYNDDAGSPGSTLAGPFLVPPLKSESGNTISTGAGPIVEYVFEATHPGVSVNAGQCYWISIVNNTTGNCFWLWNSAPPGDALSYQDEGSGFDSEDFDLAFCLNDSGCTSSTGACCLPGDVCVDGFTETDCLNMSGTYQGNGTNCLDDPCPPSNDECDNAINVAVPSSTFGSTLGATFDPNAPSSCPDVTGFGDVFVTSAGVWYSIIGTGNTITVSTCSPSTDYDTQLSVYCGCCDTLMCVGANDDDSGAQPACDLGGLNRKSTVSFCSVAGEPYLILVHGFGSNTGNFELLVTDDGSPCSSPPTSCIPRTLSLVPDTTCSDGSQITVDIVLADICENVVGGQYFLEYDDSILTLDSVAPGDPPFTNEVYVDTSTPGQIDYATGVVAPDPGARDGVMARLTFTPTGTEICDGTDLINFRPHDPPTRVTNEVGIEIVGLNLVSAQPITVDTTPPALTWDVAVTLSSDAPGCGANYTPMASATDNCDPAPIVIGTRDDSQPLNALYPVGDTIITWTATDECGNQTVEQTTVTVLDTNDVVLDLAYDGALDAPVNRCIEFVFEGTSGTEVVEQDVPFNAAGVANGVSLSVLCGEYDCVTVRDPLHSLATSIDLNVSGTTYVGAGPAVMTAGNLNGDQFIDILDFGIFVGQFGQNLPVNTPCPLPPGPHADITGDGLVWTGDFTFITNNFLSVADAGCTALVYGKPGGAASPLGQNRPLRRISVAELRRRGMHDLVVADLNNDGWLDEQDLAAFQAGQRP